MKILGKTAAFLLIVVIAGAVLYYSTVMGD